MVTPGIVALGCVAHARIVTAVKDYSFPDAIEPWNQHNWGVLHVDRRKIIFRVDTYDLTRARHSPDPTDPTVTERVLTIMLANE